MSKNTMTLGLFLGSMGYDGFVAFAGNPYPAMPGYGETCPMLAFESDTSYSVRFASLSPLSPRYGEESPFGATILTVAGLDLLEHFPRGELRHWDFVPHEILKLEQERSGFAHHPGLGYLATLLHSDSIKQQFKTALEEVVDTQRKTEEKLLIPIFLNGSGASGNGFLPGMLEILADLLSVLDESVDARVLVFVTIPNFQVDPQLADRLMVNCAALLRALPCLQLGVPRHAACTTEGYGDYTHRPIPFELILMSDLGDGSVTPTHLVSTQALIMRLLTATPVRQAWQRIYTNLRGDIAGGDIPLVSRMGASTIFLPIDEELSYRCHRLVEWLAGRAATSHSDAAALGIEYLRKHHLLETENDTQLSRQLATWDGHDVIALYYRPLTVFAPKERKPVKAVRSCASYFERAEQNILPRVESQIAGHLPFFKEALAARIGEMSREMEQLYMPGEITSILRSMAEEVRRELEVMDVLEGQLTAMIEERRKQAFVERQHLQKLAQLPWLIRRGKRDEIGHRLEQYIKYRLQIIHCRISLEVKKGTRTASDHVLGQLRTHLERYEDIVQTCREVAHQAETSRRRLLADDFASRGLGIPLRRPDAYEPRYRELDLDAEGWRTLGPGLQKEFYSELPDMEEADRVPHLDRYLHQRCKGLVEDSVNQTEYEVTPFLQAGGDPAGKIRSAIRMAQELLPADAVTGAGKRMLLVMLPRGNRSPFCQAFRAAAADLKLACTPEFVDNPNPSFIWILRWEVGRDLRSVHLCREFDQALEGASFDGGVTSFITPYWLTAPSCFVKVTPLIAQKLFVKAHVVGALIEGKEEVLYKTSADVDLKIPGMDADALAAFWEAHFSARVDVAGRYVVHIQCRGFGQVAQELRDLQHDMPAEWHEAITSCIEELIQIAEGYHQTI